MIRKLIVSSLLCTSILGCGEIKKKIDEKLAEVKFTPTPNPSVAEPVGIDLYAGAPETSLTEEGITLTYNIPTAFEQNGIQRTGSKHFYSFTKGYHPGLPKFCCFIDFSA